jgi:DNA modification methylase
VEEGLQLLDPRDLREAEENPRTIKDERYESLKRSLLADPGMLEARPIIVDAEEGDVVAGNMRLRAVLDLVEGGDWPLAFGSDEATPAVNVFVKRFESAGQRREWMLRDNQEYGEWVPEEVASLIRLHQAEGGSLEMLGFSQAEADSLLALNAAPEPEPEGDPDDVPEPGRYDDPITQLGDVWTLGEHRLICGDAGSAEDLNTLLSAGEGETETVDLIWTDPPYGVGYDAEQRESYFSADRLANPLGVIRGDERKSVDDYAGWLAHVLENLTVPLREGGAVYLCHADKMVEAAARAFRLADLYFASQIIWLKTVLVFGRSDYHYKHEPILYGWKSGAAHRWFGDRAQTTVIEAPTDHYGADREDYVHPTQKPYLLLQPCIENSSDEGEIVLDAFGGSGSTLVACERLKRRARLMELDRYYCDVIVARWLAFTGEEAYRHDGLSAASLGLGPHKAAA